MCLAQQSWASASCLEWSWTGVMELVTSDLQKVDEMRREHVGLGRNAFGSRAPQHAGSVFGFPGAWIMEKAAAWCSPIIQVPPTNYGHTAYHYHKIDEESMWLDASGYLDISPLCIGPFATAFIQVIRN